MATIKLNIFMDGARALIEVKYDDEVKKKEGYYKERWEAARQWAAKRNIVFTVLTEYQIHKLRQNHFGFFRLLKKEFSF